ncbi:MAG: phosphatidate cytidylyltransferase [Candidatus Magnetoovum sp. WYHC-5]|nr:phosphatidate cytidylyltransferase [Candidatus Magnetoovum sp. WYHC-5]
MKRIISALFLLPTLYIYIMYLPPVYFLIIICIVAFITQVEFLSMYNSNFISKYAFSLFTLGFLYTTYSYNSSILIHLFVLAFIVILILRLFVKRKTENALYDIAPLWAGFFYITVLISFLIKLRAIAPEVVIYLLAVIWGADSFALYVGKAIGKRKLYEEVSPNKTLAGAFGAIVGGIIVSMLVGVYFKFPVDIIKLFFTGIILALTGIVGDLVESMFKRDANVKDSGSFIPGHGGLLDKIDGTLFAAPVLYYMIKFFQIF